MCIRDSGKDKRRVIDDYRFAALGANTNYRVMDFNGIWQSARASYFHKAMGGYHGAKLRNIQNLFNYHIASYNNNVIDMLNIKYTIQGAEMRPNPLAMGNAWLVQSVEAHETPDDEIRGLGSNFKLTNIGGGNFLVNGETIAEANVYLSLIHI